MGYIYKITCIPENKVYIGYTSATPQKRLLIHWRNTRNLKRTGCSHYADRPLYVAMSKYEEKDFVIETLVESDDLEYLLNWEEPRQIELHNSDNPDKGYNVHPGGGGKHMTGITGISEAMRKRIGRKNRANRKNHPEMYVHSEETKKLIGLRNRGKKRSTALCEFLSKHNSHIPGETKKEREKRRKKLREEYRKNNPFKQY